MSTKFWTIERITQILKSLGNSFVDEKQEKEVTKSLHTIRKDWQTQKADMQTQVKGSK